jgi:hypothetical protein
MHPCPVRLRPLRQRLRVLGEQQCRQRRVIVQLNFCMDSLSAAISTSESGGRSGLLLPGAVNALVDRPPPSPRVLGFTGMPARLHRNRCSTCPECLLGIPGTAAHLAPESLLTLARNRCSACPGTRIVEWRFVERALQYVRKAEMDAGFDQFVLLVCAVEALWGENTPGLTKRLKSRWAAVLGGNTPADRQSRAQQFGEFYKLRSKAAR